MGNKVDLIIVHFVFCKDIRCIKMVFIFLWKKVFVSRVTLYRSSNSGKFTLLARLFQVKKPKFQNFQLIKHSFFD